MLTAALAEEEDRCRVRVRFLFFRLPRDQTRGRESPRAIYHALRRLQRKDVNRKADHYRVCGRHFVAGMLRLRG